MVIVFSLSLLIQQEVTKTRVTAGCVGKCPRAYKFYDKVFGICNLLSNSLKHNKHPCIHTYLYKCMDFWLFILVYNWIRTHSWLVLILADLELESSVFQCQCQLMSAIFMDMVTSCSTIIPTYMTMWRQTTYSVSLAAQVLKAIKSSKHKGSGYTKRKVPCPWLAALIPVDLAGNNSINPERIHIFVNVTEMLSWSTCPFSPKKMFLIWVLHDALIKTTHFLCLMQSKPQENNYL